MPVYTFNEHRSSPKSLFHPERLLFEKRDAFFRNDDLSMRVEIKLHLSLTHFRKLAEEQNPKVRF